MNNGSYFEGCLYASRPVGLLVPICLYRGHGVKHPAGQKYSKPPFFLALVERSITKDARFGRRLRYTYMYIIHIISRTRQDIAFVLYPNSNEKLT
jgi:hypothetical protein